MRLKETFSFIRDVYFTPFIEKRYVQRYNEKKVEIIRGIHVKKIAPVDNEIILEDVILFFGSPSFLPNTSGLEISDSEWNFRKKEVEYLAKLGFDAFRRNYYKKSDTVGVDLFKSMMSRGREPPTDNILRFLTRCDDKFMLELLEYLETVCIDTNVSYKDRMTQDLLTVSFLTTQIARIPIPTIDEQILPFQDSIDILRRFYSSPRAHYSDFLIDQKEVNFLLDLHAMNGWYLFPLTKEFIEEKLQEGISITGFFVENGHITQLYLEEKEHEIDIPDIPISLGDLGQLNTLSIRLNSITKIPSQIEQLEALKSVTLYGWKLSTLPDSLSKLAGLERIRLKQENELNLPQKIRAFLRMMQLVGCKVEYLPV